MKHVRRKKQATRTGPHGRCDFCQVNDASHTINGGLWWICTPCMGIHYAVENVFKGGEEE